MDDDGRHTKWETAVVRELQAKSVLIKRKRFDSWFMSRYGMNLYRGCTHDCVYCDGRAESYYVDCDFGRDVQIKVNADEVLARELDVRRRRTPLKRSFFLLGGGVGDSYQPLEETYGLTRRVLHLLAHLELPVHVLTKSSLVERDVDLLQKINRRSRVVVSMSFSGVDDETAQQFEPHASPPSERLATLRRLREAGIATGVFLMPVIPFITDTLPAMDAMLRQAKRAGVRFVIFSGMTLKEGRQKEYFLSRLREVRPELELEYANIYPGNKWGAATFEYYTAITEEFNLAAKKLEMPRRMPASLFADVLDENDRVVAFLENLDYMLTAEGRQSTYRGAARSVAQLTEPIAGYRNRLRELRGVGPTTARLIREILDTGGCRYHDSLVGR